MLIPLLALVLNSLTTITFISSTVNYIVTTTLTNSIRTTIVSVPIVTPVAPVAPVVPPCQNLELPEVNLTVQF